jgi:hypothetical protein
MEEHAENHAHGVETIVAAFRGMIEIQENSVPKVISPRF